MIEAWGLAAGGVIMAEDPAAALIAFQQFEEWAADRLGQRHQAVAQALVRQAWCQSALRNQTEACRLYQGALDILLATVGADHPDAVRLAEYVSEACTESSGIGRRLEPGRQPIAPPQTLEGLQPFNPLTLEGPTEGLESIEQRLTEALGPSGETPSADDLDPRAHGYTLGMFLREIGEFDRAIQAFEDYEGWASREYGAGDERTVEALNQVAYCQYQLGHFADACQLWDKIRTILESTHPDSPSLETLSARIAGSCPPAPERYHFGVAEQLVSAERFNEAIAAYAAYERWAALEYGPTHDYVLESMAMRGHSHERIGREREACAVYKRVLPLIADRESTPVDADEIRAFLAGHCESQEEEGVDGAAAQPPWHWPWDPPSLPDLEPDLEAVGDVLAGNEHYEEAISAYEGYEQWLLRGQEANDSAQASVLAKQAWNHARLGHHEEACRLTARAKELMEAQNGPEDQFVVAASEYLRENCR
jgi:hypothetical protein